MKKEDIPNVHVYEIREENKELGLSESERHFFSTHTFMQAHALIELWSPPVNRRKGFSYRIEKEEK